MNQITLTGRITKDIELTKAADKDVVNFVIAVKRDKDTADFIPVTVFGKQAENTVKFCGKGSNVLINGSLRIRSYEDKNKIKRYVPEVVANSYNGVEFLSTKKDNVIDEGLFVKE